MITGTIGYQAKSIEEFKELMQWAKEQGAAKVTASVGKPSDKGPNERAYIEATGGKRMRLSELEESSGLSREEVAAARLQALQSMDDSVTTSVSHTAEKLPQDDGEDLT